MTKKKTLTVNGTIAPHPIPNRSEMAGTTAIVTLAAYYAKNRPEYDMR